MKFWRNSILKYLLIVLFVSYYTGNVAFTHVHHFQTYTIVHSHPYLPGADGLPHHSHDSVAYETIEVLNAILAEPVAYYSLGIAWVLLAVFYLQHKYITVIRSVRTSNLRAPPMY